MHPPPAESALPDPAASPQLAAEAVQALDERAAWALVLAAWLHTPGAEAPAPPAPQPEPEPLAAEGLLPWLAAPPAPSDWWL